MADHNALYDAHAHVITPDTASYPPAPISGRLREGVFDNAMTAERLIEQMDARNVSQAALVQRAHVYGYDNSYVVDAAARYPDRFGAICVVDSTAPDAVSRAAEWIARGAIGIRLTEPARGADSTWLDGRHAREIWNLVADKGVTLSIQLYTWNRAERMPDLRAIAAAHGAIPIVVEHLSNLTESVEAPDYGIDADLHDLAALPNISLKLTTINLARCLNNGFDIRPLLARLGETFSFDRIMWGSDVAQSPQSYGEMTTMARASVALLDHTQQAAVLSKTAARVFNR